MNRLYNESMGRKLTKSRPKQGERLLQLRIEAGLSQKELADLIGETQQNIAYWEQADKPPRADTLPRLAKVLGISVEDLLNADDALPKRSGPKGKLQALFEEASELPRSQQEKLMDFIVAFVSHYHQSKKQAGEA